MKRDLAEKMMDRAIRIHLLGIADLLIAKRNERHRPKTVKAPLRHDDVVQAIAYTKAAHPDWKLESVVAHVTKVYDVSRAYVFKALANVAPERRKNIESGAAAFANCGYSVEFIKPRVK